MGSGFKDFAAGDILTAADVDGYLMRQTVMTFADASARDSALSGVLDEGMMAYLKDTNTLTVYDGSNWVFLSAVGRPAGLVHITTATASSGSTLDINGVFSSAYDNYRVIVSDFVTASAGAELNVQMKVGGTVATTNYYTAISRTDVTTNTFSTFRGTPGVHFATSAVSGGTYAGAARIEIINPNKAAATSAMYEATWGNTPGSQNIAGSGVLADTTQYTDLRLNASASTYSSITVRVYGYYNG